MLVLSRHRGESIRVGDDIVISVCDITPNQVRIGITAPRSVRVSRVNPPLADEPIVESTKPEEA